MRICLGLTAAKRCCHSIAAPKYLQSVPASYGVLVIFRDSCKHAITEASAQASNRLRISVACYKGNELRDLVVEDW